MKEKTTMSNKNKMKASKLTLSDALRGMRVKNWERRQSSEGATVVYVRYVEVEPIVTTQVVER